MLTSGGSSSSGCPEDFKAYLASKDKLYKLKKFDIPQLPPPPPPPPPPAKDVVYQALFNVNDTDGEPQEHGDVTIEVIRLICTHLYLTVSRLM